MDFSIPTLSRLETLHTQLPLGAQSSARIFIDAHLLACYVNPANPPTQYILHPKDAFHYHNLPNLIPHLRKHLVENSWESDVLGGLMAPFCLHINRTLRPRTEPNTTQLTRAATINLLHGLLLGLYPFNVRHPAFHRRISIAGEIRALMCSPIQAQLDFLNSHERLLTLSMMEYLANVVADFCPVEETLLVRSPQCRFVVNHLCDAWRVTTGDEPALHWDDMEKQAAQSLLSVQRQLKLCNIRPCKRSASRSNSHQLTPTLIATALEMPMIPISTPNLVAQIQLLQPDLKFQEIQAIEFLWSNISLHHLPRTLCVDQIDRLDSLASCLRLQCAMKTLYICITCALGRKTCILQQRCSLECTTSRLVCTSCKGGMQKIHLLGRILTVRQNSYFLCPKCLQPTRWTGTFSGCETCLTPPTVHSLDCCHICAHRHVASTRPVVDWENLAMRAIPLCHKHARACVTSAVYDIKALEADSLANASKR